MLVPVPPRVRAPAVPRKLGLHSKSCAQHGANACFLPWLRMLGLRQKGLTWHARTITQTLETAVILAVSG
jgi:hypothetical protein